MDNQTKAPGLDIFKLLVFLGLIAALVYYYLQNQPAGAESAAAPTAASTSPSTTVPTEVSAAATLTPPEAAAPPIPEAEVALKLDEQATRLVNPQGEAVYELNPVDNDWQPVVPQDFGQLKLGQDSSEKWVLAAADGTARYQWDETRAAWQIAPEFLANPPEFPPSEVELTYDEASGALLSPQGTPLYTLDAASGQWAPVIPAEIKAGLPADATTRQQENGWVIVAADGTVLYTWDPAGLEWTAVKYTAAVQNTATLETTTEEGTTATLAQPVAADTPSAATTRPAPTAVKITWPATPPASVTLTLDEPAKRLVDADGEAIYELGPAGSAWLPVVPADMSQLKRTQDTTGKWILAAVDGAPRYRWDETIAAWQIAPEFLAHPPKFPSSPVKLTYDEAMGALVSPEKALVYVLDAATEQWTPVIQAALQAELPEGAAVSQVEGGWAIVAKDGTALYTWDSAGLEWMAAQKTATVETTTAVTPPAATDTPAARPTSTAAAAATTAAQPTPTATRAAKTAAQPTPTPSQAAALPAQPTSTSAAAATTAAQPTPASTTAATTAAQPTPAAATTATQPTPSATAAGVPPAPPTPTPGTVVCNGAPPSRIQVGDTVEALTNLNLRDAPGMNGKWLRTNIFGTRLKVIGGPVCLATGKGQFLFWNSGGEFLWWNVQQADGLSGWSAEGDKLGPFYYLGPVK